MTREWLVERFGDPRQRRAATGSRGMARPDRGDHDLNPGTGPASHLTPAAVLIPIVDRAQGMTVLMTRRTDHLASHAGQISFPGGHVEPGDGSPEEAALRETEEEIGLTRGLVHILGRLDAYVTGTGFDITPVVGVVKTPFELDPDPHEVAEVFEVPLDFLLDPANHQRTSRRFGGEHHFFYAMPYDDYYIWGATAGMVVNLYELLIRP
jgi:8-oxo-dGTP pyrophosphatase MutT (NUDIX family)